MRGERYDDYDRGGPGDGRDRYDRQDRYTAQDRYGRDGRDRPGYGPPDRDGRGRDRAPGDRPGRPPAGRPPAGRDYPDRDRAGRPPANRPPSGRPGERRPDERRPPASRPPASRPPASQPRADRFPAGGPYNRRDAGTAGRKGRSARVRGLAVVLAVAATASLAVTGYAVSLGALNRAHLGGHADATAGSYVVSGIASFVSSNAIVQALNAATPSKPATSPSSAPTVSLTLTARDKANCPAAATACVDLDEHITWLQDNGKVSYGPVQMEPGPPGSVHATPTGTFNVAWKAGPTYMSTIYHELIPWAVFFAPGGIAFHEGSLTVGSHGCVHLTMDAAHYYNQHLPVGAEVVVF